MSSPFPGMDPYLENPAFWCDFHASFITYWRDTLADLLPENYEVRIDERVNLVELPAERIKRIAPDLAISQGKPSTTVPAAPAGVATLEPVTIPLVIEEEIRETFIEILHRPKRTLVAVLELLSPANKEEPGRSLYLAKRNALLHQAVHLVELDLLLGGQRLPLQKDLPPADYFALVSRGDCRPDCQVYGWSIRQPLLAIPIPLKSPDPAIWLNLAAVFGMAYERGRYARSLDYTAPPPVTLGESEMTWVRERVGAQW